MSFNTDQIVQEIRREFESTLQYVQESQTSSADEVERGLFKQLLALGGELMQLFFCLRCAEYPHDPIETEAGNSLPYHGDTKRGYYSIFGKLPCYRPYFYAPGVAGVSPLDEQLSLGEDCYSDLVRELVEYFGVEVPYDKVREMFARVLGLSLSTQAISGMVAADATDMEVYYEQKPAPPVEQEATILVIQSDGKGVPIVRDTPAEAKVRLGKGEKQAKKKEAVVTGAYTIEPNVRTPEEVVASFFHHETEPTQASSPRSKPQNKHIWATMAGKEAALQRLAKHVATREDSHIQHRIALADGCQALQNRLLDTFPGFTLILDFVHGNEYLWKAANCLYDEKSPFRTAWVEAQTLLLLSGKTQQVIDHLRALAQQPNRSPSQQETLQGAANYFERNEPYMHYDVYLAQGWPIASGVIEGACRHFVKDRCELSGMRWTLPGVENLLRLRAVAENGDWDTYHQFRKQRRHLRLYGSPFPERTDPETQVLASPTSNKVIPLKQVAKHRLTQRNLDPQPLAA